MTGDPIFTDQRGEPLAARLRADLPERGRRRSASCSPASGEDHKVAILSQNDDYGEGYVEGFKTAIEGADNIEIVKELTYEATDTSVDAQLTELAAIGRRRVLQRDVDHPARDLVAAEDAGARLAAQLVPAVEHVEPDGDPRARWRGRVPRRLHGGVRAVGGRARRSPRARRAPRSSSDLKEYANYPDVPAFPHCVWSYLIGATLEEVFGKMTEPTRENFMEALRDDLGLRRRRSCSRAPPSTRPRTASPPSRPCSVQKYNGKGYAHARELRLTPEERIGSPRRTRSARRRATRSGRRPEGRGRSCVVSERGRARSVHAAQHVDDALRGARGSRPRRHPGRARGSRR